MSGGSYDYLCYKMEDAARRLMKKHQPNYRRAFGEMMLNCSKAMHDVEWVDSCDSSEGDDEEAIMQCLLKQDVLQYTLEEAKRISKELDIIIKEIDNESIQKTSS